MEDEQKIFAAITVVAALAIIALLYSAFSIQGTAAKVEARDITLAGLNANGNAPQPIQEPAEITLTTITDSNEAKLITLASLAEQLQQLPELKIVSEKTLERNSTEAKQLIEKYRIERIPTILLQGETKKAQVLAENWPKIGTTENDGTLVLRNIPPIYFEVSTGKLRGKTTATFVSVPDKNEVFDSEEVYTQILQSAFGVTPVVQETFSYDSKEGKALLAKYKMEKVPAFFLSGDLNAYNGFPQIWLQGGSVESDGNYVFRDLEAIRGIRYFDLNKNEIVQTAEQ
ncbi:MAG TPA: hypothetical protein VJG83_02320 [archaeon]|nr:hypothetical protein [archaeon]